MGKKAANLPTGQSQYQVVGRFVPNAKYAEDNAMCKVYRMNLFAKNKVVARSRFWYFLGRLCRVKKANGQIISVSQVSFYSQSALQAHAGHLAAVAAAANYWRSGAAAGGRGRRLLRMHLRIWRRGAALLLAALHWHGGRALRVAAPSLPPRTHVHTSTPHSHPFPSPFLSLSRSSLRSTRRRPSASRTLASGSATTRARGRTTPTRSTASAN